LASGQILIPFSGFANPLGAQADKPVFVKAEFWDDARLMG
jgi:hypothetical protein